ncbi:CDP-diacylglycerol--serine O-phosphatidyltransferase [Halobacteriales archaeon QS_8_69_26]|nr:MAG: CDP-diacylglycerol--serine O-phosphatidyltransferase [Halobacteriales archaeon QS_8_69_26]
MKPRFVGRLGVADAVTTFNAVLGFLAVAAATAAPGLAARAVLLAGIADGLDGVLARRYGSSKAGPYLDSLADVASFAVAPAVLVFAVVREAWDVTVALSPAAATPRTALAVGVPALFVAAAVVRLGLYTAYDVEDEATEGAQSTLAATVLGAAVLSGYTGPTFLLAVTGAFVYLMLAPIRYPDLLARDAFLMGVVHFLAVLFPRALDRSFPVALLILGLAYMLLSPWLYWRDGFPTLGSSDGDGGESAFTEDDDAVEGTDGPAEDDGGGDGASADGKGNA